MKTRRFYKITRTVLTGFMLSAILAGCGHEHTWTEATCTQPKTCIECGETEGEPLEHDWQEANCESPKTCKTCGATEGSALGHDWSEATFDSPKICKVCGEAEGNPLTMKISEWSYADLFYISDDYLMAKDASDNKYYLIDYDGNRIGSDIIENIGWESVKPGLDKGCFAVSSESGDVLYDKELNRIFSTAEKDNGEMKITGFKEGYVICSGTNNSDSYYLYNLEDDGEITLRSAPLFANGKIIWRDHGFYFGDDYDEYFDIDYSMRYNYADYSLALNIESLSENILVDGKPVLATSDSDNDGWIFTAVYKSDLTSFESCGFLNLDSGEYVISNNNSMAFSWPGISESGRQAAVFNGLAAVVPDEEFEAAQEGDFSFRVFSIKNGEYVSDSYKFISTSLGKIWPVIGQDEKWGYFDTQSLSQIGEWHDAASGFCNGYALAKDGNTVRVINENMEQIGETYDTDMDIFFTIGVIDMIDYGIYDDKILFIARKGDEYHLVTFE